MLYRELFCDCEACVSMELENTPKCKNQDIVGPPSAWKLHISRQLKNPVFEDGGSEESDQFDPSDAVPLSKKRKRRSNKIKKQTQKKERQN